jgi:hypothetical protein
MFTIDIEGPDGSLNIIVHLNRSAVNELSKSGVKFDERVLNAMGIEQQPATWRERQD